MEPIFSHIQRLSLPPVLAQILRRAARSAFYVFAHRSEASTLLDTMFMMMNVPWLCFLQKERAPLTKCSFLLADRKAYDERPIASQNEKSGSISLTSSSISNRSATSPGTWSISCVHIHTARAAASFQEEACLSAALMRAYKISSAVRRACRRYSMNSVSSALPPSHSSRPLGLNKGSSHKKTKKHPGERHQEYGDELSKYRLFSFRVLLNAAQKRNIIQDLCQ